MRNEKRRVKSPSGSGDGRKNRLILQRSASCFRRHKISPGLFGLKNTFLFFKYKNPENVQVDLGTNRTDDGPIPEESEPTMNFLFGCCLNADARETPTAVMKTI